MQALETTCLQNGEFSQPVERCLDFITCCSFFASYFSVESWKDGVLLSHVQCYKLSENGSFQFSPGFQIQWEVLLFVLCFPKLVSWSYL